MLAFEMMAKSAEHQRAYPQKAIPELKGFLKLENEIRDFQHALTVTAKIESKT
jgi:hypothetical protein